jgi:hypothetical protein
MNFADLNVADATTALEPLTYFFIGGGGLRDFRLQFLPVYGSKGHLLAEPGEIRDVQEQKPKNTAPPDILCGQVPGSVSHSRLCLIHHSDRPVDLPGQDLFARLHTTGFYVGARCHTGYRKL